jgi:hypothetical protein
VLLANSCGAYAGAVKLALEATAWAEDALPTPPKKPGAYSGAKRGAKPDPFPVEDSLYVVA